MWCLTAYLTSSALLLAPKHFHHPVLMIRNRPGCHVKDVANFLHHLSFSQQLQHFTLSVGEAFVFLDQLLPF